MTDSAITDLNKRFDAARGERDRMETIFDDAIRLTMPARTRFRHNDPIAAADDIFDETGANAVSEFVSRMQAGLTPPFTEFVQLRATEDVDEADRPAINEDLGEIQKVLFEEIWRSNFSQESAECFNDLAISTGIMLHEENPDGDGFTHRAIPITEAYIERGPNDSVGGVFRQRKLKAGLIEATYRNAELTDELRRMAGNEADRQVEIIEYTARDWSKPAEHIYRHKVWTKDPGHMIVDRELRGEGSNPFHAFRWATAAGETWGRGPLLNALGAIRTTNLMVELVLENAAMSIVGIYQSDNDGVVNADNINLLPGSIIPVEPNTRGLEPVQAAAGNFNMRDLVLNDQRLNIKRALYNDMLSDPNKTPATATEVAERMADLANRTNAGFSRVFFEFIQPYIRRCLYILERQGRIELPTKGGRGIKFRAVSPLAMAQHGRELQMFSQHHQLVASMFGPQAAAAQYDLEQALPWLRERMVLDGKLFKDPKDIAKGMMEGLQQAAAVMPPQGGQPQ